MTLAVSGGADSVAMLLVFNELKEELDIDINVVHVEHGIRGDASVSDSEFVSHLCDSLNIPCKIAHVRALEYAKDCGLSVEEAARKLRYESLKTFGHDIIATAHNADDRAETFLFNLIRGTGVAGLSGISTKTTRDGMTIIRPLICARRYEIEKYLRKKGQTFCTDETNKEDTYARNKLRLNIIPQLKEINAQAISHINSASEYLSELYRYALYEANTILKEAGNEDLLDISIIKETPIELMKIVLMTWLYQRTKGSHNVTSQHVKKMVDMVLYEGNKSLDIPGYKIVKEYNYLKTIKKESSNAATSEKNKIFITKSKLLSLQNMEIEFENESFILQVINFDSEADIPILNYTKWFDYDKIGEVFALRKREEGDYFTINGKMSRKKYNRYCIDEKIPPSEREEKILFCDDNHIIWMPGYRISEYYKVQEDTKKILVISRR